MRVLVVVVIFFGAGVGACVLVCVCMCLWVCACACSCHRNAVECACVQVCVCVHVCIITANLLPHEQKRVGHDKFPLIPIAYYASYAQMVLPNAEFPVVVKVSHAHRYVRVVCEFVRCVNRSFSLFL